jgi:uncharacterized protein YecE (DUF72 family)
VRVYVGTAGWTIPREHAARFLETGSHLERYARVLGAVEINSSFYRPHRVGTYARWASSVPAGFRFSVKVPREITHEACLEDVRDALERFLSQVAGLGDKLGPLLVQLPPSFELELSTARKFFALLRTLHAGPVVCEPRHASWFGDAAERLFVDHRVARVAADPPPVAGAGEPGGFAGLVYHRWHGSPRKYFSAYSRDRIEGLAARVATRPNAWCIFDNTGAGAALGDALALTQALGRARTRDR